MRSQQSRLVNDVYLKMVEGHYWWLPDSHFCLGLWFIEKPWSRFLLLWSRPSKFQSSSSFISSSPKLFSSWTCDGIFPRQPASFPGRSLPPEHPGTHKHAQTYTPSQAPLSVHRRRTYICTRTIIYFYNGEAKWRPTKKWRWLRQ